MVPVIYGKMTVLLADGVDSHRGNVGVDCGTDLGFNRLEVCTAAKEDGTLQILLYSASELMRK